MTHNDISERIQPDLSVLCVKYIDATCRGCLRWFCNSFFVLTARLFAAGALCTGFCFLGWWTVCTFSLAGGRFSFLGFRRPRKNQSDIKKEGSTLRGILFSICPVISSNWTEGTKHNDISWGQILELLLRGWTLLYWDSSSGYSINSFVFTEKMHIGWHPYKYSYSC